MSDHTSASREAALAELRYQQEQARARLGIVVPIGHGDTLQGALQKAGERESQSSIRGDWIHSSGFKYPTHTERLRWARTREIITRSSPGADEDSSYLEIVARQAASVEMILRGEQGDQHNTRNAAICDHVLLGTFPTINPDAFARRHRDFFFVLLSAGLIEFVYQAAKAAVLSWKPVMPGGGAAAFKSEPEDVEAVLAENPLPVSLLGMTLQAYLFRGLPRAVGYSPPPRNYQLPLQILTNCNERFIVAHEYGHTLHDALDVVHPGASVIEEEFAADIFAFHLVVASGRVLDLMPPNFSTQGAYFTLTALDIIRQALDLVRYGEIREDRGFAGHPPVAHRLERLRQCYLQTVSNRDDALSIRPALSAARTLQLLWSRLRKEGAEEKWPGCELHRIWKGVATGIPN